MTLIQGQAGISMFQILQVRYALDIQAKTGLRHSRGSVLKLAQQRYGIKAKTAAAAVTELDEIIAKAREEAEA
jgi:hypothetical protein